MDDVDGLTDTDATTSGAEVTWTFAVPVTPPDDAVIVTVPTAIAVTKPLLDTEATPELDDDQFIAIPESTAVPIIAVAPSCVCCPTWITVVAGVTLIEVGNGASTAAGTDAVTPSAIAVIVALPACTSVTMPVPDTVALLGFDDTQATALADTA